MKSDVRRILIAMVLPMFLIFILYTIKVLEVGMDWDFTRLGVYPLSKKGCLVFSRILLYTVASNIYWPTLYLYSSFHGVFFTFTGALHL